MHPVARAAFFIAVCSASGCVQILGDFKKGESTGTGGTTASGTGGTTTSTTTSAMTSSSTGLACMPPTPTACVTGCTDLTQDAKNCGECGHDCQGTMCTSGICAPTTLVPAASTSPQTCDMAVDNAHVYWTSATNIFAAPKAGGAASSLLNTTQPCHIVVDSTDVYYVYTNAFAGLEIAKTPLLGPSGITLLAAGQAGAYGIALDQTSVYWAHTGGVSKILKAGGTIVVLASNQTNPHRVALDSTTTNATKIFWTNQAVAGQVNSAPAAAPGTVFSYATAEPSPNSVAPDATHLYWLDAASLNRSPLGVAMPENLQMGLVGATELHIDTTDAYWLELPAGTIRRAPLDKASAMPLTLVASGATNMTIDDSYVYWTTSSAVMRVPK